MSSLTSAAGALSLVFGAGLVLETSPSVSACSASDIRIVQVDHHPPVADSTYGHVIGELQSNCDEATGAALLITLRDQDGRIVIAEELWAAGAANIPPHSYYPFNLVIAEVRQVPPPVMQVVVSQVYRWGDYQRRE